MRMIGGCGGEGSDEALWVCMWRKGDGHEEGRRKGDVRTSKYTFLRFVMNMFNLI